jgi:hypothetical protein
MKKVSPVARPCPVSPEDCLAVGQTSPGNGGN